MKTGDFQTDVLVALERLEVNMESLVGNGQPGRIKLIEDDVISANSRLDRLWGGLIILGFLLGSSLIGEALIHLAKK